MFSLPLHGGGFLGGEMGTVAAALAPLPPQHPPPGAGVSVSLRQRPHCSPNSRAIYVPRCPDEEWTPLFLSSGWYFNSRLTGNRSRGAVCPFLPLRAAAEVHIGVWLLQSPEGFVTPSQNWGTPESPRLGKRHFTQPIAALSPPFVAPTAMPGMSQGCQRG